MEHLAYSTEYSLSHVVIILFAAIFVVVSFKKIKLSPVIGYIIAGAIIGPHCLKLVGYNDATKALAEFGVVFLLFSIGLEMTLERLRDMKKYILGCGLLQFLLTSVIFSAIIYLFMKNLYASIVIGTKDPEL